MDNLYALISGQKIENIILIKNEDTGSYLELAGNDKFLFPLEEKRDYMHYSTSSQNIVPLLEFTVDNDVNYNTTGSVDISLISNTPLSLVEDVTVISYTGHKCTITNLSTDSTTINFILNIEGDNTHPRYTIQAGNIVDEDGFDYQDKILRNF
jgi:hypothetical protein